MKKKARDKNNEMLREYDFSQGVRGKYARRYARGSNVVVLEPDVAKILPNAEAVNSSPRSLGDYSSKKITRFKIEDHRRGRHCRDQAPGDDGAPATAGRLCRGTVRTQTTRLPLQLLQFMHRNRLMMYARVDLSVSLLAAMAEFVRLVQVE